MMPLALLAWLLPVATGVCLVALARPFGGAHLESAPGTICLGSALGIGVSSAFFFGWTLLGWNGGWPVVAVEAGVGESLRRLVGTRGIVYGIDRFGASAPTADLAEEYGFTPDQLAGTVIEHLRTDWSAES